MCVNIAFLLKEMKAQAALLIVMIGIFEFVSNASSLIYTYAFASITLASIEPVLSHGCAACLKPFIDLSFLRPSFWSCQVGLGLGILFGILMGYTKIKPVSQLLLLTKGKIDFIYGSVLSKLVPLFIIGFLANSFHMGVFENALAYGTAISFSLACVSLYIFFIFIIGMGGVAKAFAGLKNIIPAFVLSLSSASSLITMPTTISCTAKNSRDPLFPKSIIPATTNIQLIGDCIFNAYLILVLIKTFGLEYPSFLQWMNFTFWYVLARFGTSAVLGGVLFVVLPLYEGILGFTPEMIAIVWAFNVLADPLITCANVIGNSGLCLVFERIWGKLRKKPSP